MSCTVTILCIFVALPGIQTWVADWNAEKLAAANASTSVLFPIVHECGKYLLYSKHFGVRNASDGEYVLHLHERWSGNRLDKFALRGQRGFRGMVRAIYRVCDMSDIVYIDRTFGTHPHRKRNSFTHVNTVHKSGLPFPISTTTSRWSLQFSYMADSSIPGRIWTCFIHNEYTTNGYNEKRCIEY